MSMPASVQKTVTPVFVSPLMSCHGMALPPRYFGSSDGWKQMLDSRGGYKSLYSAALRVMNVSGRRDAP